MNQVAAVGYATARLEHYLVKPWTHQLRAITAARSLPEYALFFEQGTGKTSTAINILRFKFADARRVYKTLVFCPPVVCVNWEREFLAHSKIPKEKITVLTGTGKKRTKVFLDTIAKDPFHVFITNYEAVQNAELMHSFLMWAPEALVCDESQRLKSHDSKRAQAVAKIADRTKTRLILSGTPILNSGLDIFQQFRILDRGETFGLNYYTFRAQYFVDKNAGMPTAKHFPNWQPRSGCLELINKLVYKKAMRVTKAECLDLPPIVRTEIPIELGAEQRAAYDSMRDEFVAFLKSKVATAELAITKGLRLQQIASGFLKTEDGSEIAFDDVPRLDALKDLLEDIAPNEKVIVWACFRHNYAAIQAICDKLKLRAVCLYGGITPLERQTAIDEFQGNPDVRIMIASAAAGGVGVNLTAASTMIFYSRTFSLEQDLQAEARNHRGGSEIHAKITRIDLVAENTMDRLVSDALKAKLKISDVILEWRNKL